MRAYVFLLVSLFSVGITTFFSLLPLAGVSQADISNMYPTSITPAGFTFSIWSLIYLSWIGLGIYYALGYKKIGKKVLLLCIPILLSVFWLIPWHYDFIFGSLIIMLSILGSLLYIFYRKEKYKDRYFQCTLELYLGWILVATIANIHITLVAYNIYFFPVFLSLISIFGGMLLISTFIHKRKAFIPAYVYIWALFGIFIAQDSIPIKVSVCIAFLTLAWLILWKHPLRPRK